MKQDAGKNRTHRLYRRQQTKRIQLLIALPVVAVLATVAVLAWKNMQPEVTPTVAVSPTPTVQLAIDPNAGELITPPPRSPSQG